MKKIKNKYEDEMLKQLKYSPPINDDFDFILDDTEYEDKSTQLPDITNNFSQTVKKEMEDKGVDTYDELNKIIGAYLLQVISKNFKSKEPSRGELMAVARTLQQKPREALATVPVQQNDEERLSIADVEDFVSRNAIRGFRLAQAVGNTALFTGQAVGTATELTLDTLMYLYNLSQQQNQEEPEEEDDDEEEEEEQPSGSTDQPTFIRERSRSRDDDTDDDLGERLLRRGASRSRSSSGDGGYPKKKK